MKSCNTFLQGVERVRAQIPVGPAMDSIDAQIEAASDY